MTEKRFKIIDKQFISYYGGDGHQISDGDCKFWLWHNQEESQKVCDKLNVLLDENKQLKQLIKKVLETTPIEHSLAIDLKNSIRELYE